LSGAVLKNAVAAARRKTGITRSGEITIVGFFFLWITARIVAGKVIFLFAYGVLVLLGMAFAMAPRRLRLAGERTGLFPRAHQGDRLEVNVELAAQRRVANILLEERVPERLGTPVRVPVAKLAAGETITHTYGLRCTRRGVYQVGPLVAVAKDPLGLTQRETVVAEPFELLVHPRIELVSDRPLTRQFEDPPIRPPVSKPWPSGLEFYGMRDYTPGDDLRRIVWRASARVGHLMVREAEQGITDQITIMLDSDRARHSRDGDGISESFETGIRVAGSLGVRHLREGYEVRCDTNSGPLTRSLRSGTAQLILLDALARLELSREPLTRMINRVAGDARRSAHNVIITPHLGPSEAAQLKLLLNKGVSVLVVALLWNEDEAESNTLAVAASLGCQVVGVHPGEDLSTALFNPVRAPVG
jgi:uncharacterized protein (DUF58 family)